MHSGSGYNPGLQEVDLRQSDLVTSRRIIPPITTRDSRRNTRAMNLLMRDQLSMQQHIDHEQMVRDNIGWMLNLAQHLLGDRGLAEDAVQDAFISAFQALDKFEGRSSLKTWLHRITVNAALTKLRQSKRRAEQSIDLDLPEFDQYDCRIEAPWHYMVPLEEVIENDDLRDRVRESIATLPDSYRIVLQLRDIEGYDTSEVAQLLEISEANVKVRLHRARAVLKKRLEPILRGEEI
jgi:RNA polymerase sigma-70 factor (ECF subfamily)